MKIAKLGILVGMLVLLVGLAQAGINNITCTYSTPTSSATIDGKCYNITVQLTGNVTLGKNATSCTANLGTTTLGRDNITDNLANFTCIDTTAIMFDSTTYSLSGFCANTSATTPENVSCTSSTSLKSDNTNPISSITSPTSGAANDQGLTVSGDCKNASAATLWLDGNSYAMTISGNAGSEACSYTFGSLSPSDGAYQAYIVSKDQNDDQTTSSVINLIVNAAKKGKGAIMGALATQQQAQEQQQIAQTKKSNLVTIGIIAAIIVVAYLMFGGKGKK